MSTLAKLRALHEEVCSAWRKQSEPAISEGEAEVISLGFMVLERLVSRIPVAQIWGESEYSETNRTLSCYIDHVHHQFDDDADIKISGK